jgi:hypothetical protein
VSGSGGFSTMDASKKYNNDLGTLVDAPFLNQLPVAMIRHRLQIAGESGTIPPIILNARSMDNNEPAKVIFHADGSVDYQFETTVIEDKKSNHIERLVAASPGRAREILDGMLRKAKSSNQTIYSLAGKQITSVDDLPEIATVEETTLFKASVVAMDGTTWVRGLFKMVLGLGHVVPGPD